MCIPHIVHTNNPAGGHCTNTSIPAKEIDPTADEMMRHIRSSLTLFFFLLAVNWRHFLFIL